MIEGILSVVFSTYGLTGILMVAVTWLTAKMFFLDRDHNRLEGELQETQEEMKAAHAETKKIMKERGKITDGNFKETQDSLNAIKNWAVSTGTGDVSWLQQD